MKKLKKLFGEELFWTLFALALFVLGFVFEKTGLDVPSVVLFCAAVAAAGWSVFWDSIRGILRRDFLDEKFLMTVACIGALALQDFKEAAAVMIFYQIGEYFQDKAVERSRASIRSLMDICPDKATVIRDGKEETVDAEDVEVGDLLVIRTGERVPVDAVITEGRADIDTSALTGESVPRNVGVGDTVESGVVLVEGVLRCRAERAADESAAARILNLVENASEKKSKEEAFITKFAKIYTPFVVGCALVLGLIVPLFTGFDFPKYIERALTFLVISCPCALVISVPMAFFGGIGGAASRGILYKGGNVFSSVARAGTVAFDKTGTLTTGKFSVSDVCPAGGMSREKLLSYAATAEYGSNHPVAKSVKEAVGADIVAPASTEEVSGLGIIATSEGHRIAVGNRKLMEKELGEKSESIYNAEQNTSGMVYVAVDGAYAGAILIADTVKPEAKAAVAALKAGGVRKTVMLSGDRRAIAEKVGREIGLDEVHAELMPDEKYKELEALMAEDSSTVMYVGDGINDAPSIARADVGVAMGAIGQDSAIEAADVVIMSDSLDKLPTAVKVARKTLRISKENIVFALAVKAAVMILGCLGLASMWMAVFADVGVAVLDILNAMRTLRIKDAG